MLNKNGRFIHTFGSRGKSMNQFDAPLGICSMDQKLLICDRINERIQIYDPSTLFPVRSIALDGLHPLGICSTPERLVVVSTDSNVILVINQERHIIKRFSSRAERFVYPFGICCNSKNEIILSDYCASGVGVFSLDGLFLRGLDSKGPSFYHTAGLCVDSEDNIYTACRRDNKIGIFHDKPIQEIPFPEPFALCIMDKRIIATSDQHSIGIFSN